jgi:hypothetical protein
MNAFSLTVTPASSARLSASRSSAARSSRVLRQPSFGVKRSLQGGLRVLDRFWRHGIWVDHDFNRLGRRGSAYCRASGHRQWIGRDQLARRRPNNLACIARPTTVLTQRFVTAGRLTTHSDQVSLLVCATNGVARPASVHHQRAATPKAPSFGGPRSRNVLACCDRVVDFRFALRAQRGSHAGPPSCRRSMHQTRRLCRGARRVRARPSRSS